MQVLQGHTSPETAYMVNDYPYGRDRCRIRFWLESDPKKGYRFCSQTEHPRKLIWNAPKKSTYCLLAGVMYLDEKNHVVWSGLTEYSSVEQVKSFIERFPEAASAKLKAWCMQKSAYCLARAKGKAVFTINGIPQSSSVEELKRNADEANLWAECSRMIAGNFADATVAP